MEQKRFIEEITVFRGRALPEKGTLAGYGAIINAFALPMPIPHTLALICSKNKRYETEGWKVFTPKYQPDDDLYKQLVFAIKYEGINLLCFKILFNKLSKKNVKALLQKEPTGQYTRKIWFLYEWLMDQQLDIPDLKIKNFVPLVDENIQYAIKGTNSSRHRIINNLPGTRDYCPLIDKTEKLEKQIKANYPGRQNEIHNVISKELLHRASTFLLLSDSKASFTIEGEVISAKRATNWGRAIGQAGSTALSKEELLRLQQIVIESSRFIDMGFRKEGGFIGTRDRMTNDPIPDHISARWQDLDSLIGGLITASEVLENENFDAVLAAAIIAFGFVFIHPFVDGNGRIHRYLIHHILAVKKFAQAGMIFPVSSSILDRMDDYHKVLESYSRPLLDFIEWKPTSKKNIEVQNDTADYYRYFNATEQVEFLYDCVEDTIQRVIPDEVAYLKNYDEFKLFIDDQFEMPDNLVALLARFLEQNNGRLSKRAKKKEFSALHDDEVELIEKTYYEIFSGP